MKETRESTTASEVRPQTTAEEAVHFLENNPDIFIDRPDLLENSGLMDESGAPKNVLNLRDRVFRHLNKEREELLHLLDLAISTVRENEKIEADFLAVEKILFQYLPSAETFSRVCEELERRFGLDHASLLLASNGNENRRLAAQTGSWRIREMEENIPADVDGARLTGNLTEGADLLFPEKCRAGLRSTAVVPLREEEKILGYLLLGSSNPERYSEKMDTHLLERLAVRLTLWITLCHLLSSESLR